MKQRKKYDIDEIDQDIIKVLQKDARLSSDELSKILNISSTTIRRRVRNLIRNEVIRIVAVTDPTKMGFPILVEIHMELSHKADNDIADYLSKYEEVKAIFFVTGRLNCRALAAFRTTDEFQKFMRTVISNIEGLISVETYIFLEIKKGKFMLNH